MYVTIDNCTGSKNENAQAANLSLHLRVRLGTTNEDHRLMRTT